MTTDRFDILHDEWLDAWVEDNIRYLYEVCADYIPWNDAKPSSDEEETGPWVATSQVEDPAPTGWQESSSSSASSAA